jgi:uncharacterized protein
MKTGKTNLLTVSHGSEHGFYLKDSDESQQEVLLPSPYCPEHIRPGDQISVFVFRDSDDRLVALNIKPFAEAGEFAWLKVTDVNKFGAFVDWGLPKELLVPFAEQHQKLEVGNSYLIYIKLDEKTDRLIGSAKLNKYVDDNPSELVTGQEVNLRFYQESELGFKALVDGKYNGLLFTSDMHKKIKIGDQCSGYVKNIREDGKIDLSLYPLGYENSIDVHMQLIQDVLEAKNGFISLTDKSHPKEINDQLGISKKAFKKAVGALLRKQKIEIQSGGIRQKK